MRDEGPSFEHEVAFLRRCEVWPVPARRVDVVQTHLACVFLTDAHAFKLKRPIRYHSVDFTTVQARREACENEVRLNRRLAADVYQGVIPLLTTTDGALTLGPPGTPIDWLVQMRRLPVERMLDRLIDRDEVRETDLQRLGRVFADFYSAQPPLEHDPERHLARLARITTEDCRALQGHLDGIPESTLTRIMREQADFLRMHADRIAERVRAGKVVEGHGDLRPEHVCLLEQPVVIDALEFDGDLRALDPFSDLAFLALECRRLGAPEVGQSIVEAYARQADDPVDRGLLSFYWSQHAVARAKLAVWHVEDPGPRGVEAWRAKARSYLLLAAEAFAR